MLKKLTFLVLVVFTLSISCGQEQPKDTSALTNWQLFIDDYWIADSANITATLHQPQKYPDNPLIRGNIPWEQNPYCFGSVIYDEDESLFKIWYMSYNFGLPVADRTPVLYATSADGIHWKRPNLGLFAFQGSKENNIVLTNYGFHDFYSPSVIKDIADSDPDRRYKMIWWDFPLGDKGYQDDGLCVAFSPDGVHWKKYPGNPVLHAKKGEHSISDVMSVMQDQRTGAYVAYTKGWKNINTPMAFRQIVRTESSDFVHWSEPEVVITHKHDIHDPQSYGMSVSQIGNLFIGLISIYKNPGNETIDIQLTVSHDNRNWTRVANQATFIPNGAPDSWDSGMIFTAPLLNHGEQTLIYYGGWNGAHNKKNRRSGIGLATLRKNGFVSLDAGSEAGTVTTPAMRNVHGPLLVNANAGDGELRAELLNAGGIPIPGYTAADCLPVKSDGIAQTIRWRKHAELPGTEERLRLRFVITAASLYGFYAGDDVLRVDE